MIIVTCEVEDGKDPLANTDKNYRVKVLRDADSVYSIDIAPVDRGGSALGPIAAIQVGLQMMLNQMGGEAIKLFSNIPDAESTNASFMPRDPFAQDWTQFFRKHRDRRIRLQWAGARFEDTTDISLEQLYQAFKDRLEAERAEAIAR